MFSRWMARLAPAMTLAMLLAMGLPLFVAAVEPGNSAFEGTWSRTDRPVLDGVTARTWMWGPEANWPVMDETYDEAPGGQRQVQYYDKARMEITNPNGDAGSIWYVTNGLLVVELITGQMQVGDNRFEPRSPADVNVAGDFDDPTGPTYATFGALLDESPRPIGLTITERVNRLGVVTNDPALEAFGVLVGQLDQVTNHAIAAPFWDFMNSSGIVYENGQYINQPLFENPYFATGRPITEAYWATVNVGGQQRDVLMQCFERRCLTYTPGNPDGFVVEAGNVGQHYYAWRYGEHGGDDPHDPTPTPDPEFDTARVYAPFDSWGEGEVDISIDSPTQVAVAPGGEIYVAATGRHQILKFAPTGELLDAWPQRANAGSDNGEFNSPTGVAVDLDGFVYVADFGNDRIQKFNASGDFVTTWGATGAAKGNFDGPYAVSVGTYLATDEDIVYVTDIVNNRVQQFSLTGTFIDSWGSFGNGPDELSAPHGITALNKNLVFVADAGNGRVQVRNSLGELVGNIGSPGSDPGQLAIPVAVGAYGNGDILVSELGNDRVQAFSLINLSPFTYEHAGYLGTKGSGAGQFDNPQGIGIDVNGNVYIADGSNNRLQIFDETGAFIDAVADGNIGRIGSPFNIELDPSGRVFVADPTINAIEIFTPDGTFIDRWGPYLDGTKGLGSLRDIAFDTSGNAYLLAGGAILKLTAEGGFLGFFETGVGMGSGYSLSSSIAVDDDGNVYVADTDNMRIQKFAPDFSLTTEWGVESTPDATEFRPIDVATYDHEIFVFDEAGRVIVFDHYGVYLRHWTLARNEASPFGLVPKSLTIDRDGYVYTAEASNLIQKFSRHGDYITSIGDPGVGDGQIDVIHGVAVDAQLRVYTSETIIQGPGAYIEVFVPVG